MKGEQSTLYVDGVSCQDPWSGQQDSLLVITIITAVPRINLRLCPSGSRGNDYKGAAGLILGRTITADSRELRLVQ